jgi:hypothetical protein
MATRKTVIEETLPSEEASVVRTTKKVVNPDIHTEVVEEKNTVDSIEPTRVKQTKVIHEPLVKTEHPQEIYETKKTIFRSHQVIWYLLGVLEVLLGFRIALKAIGADPTSGFASLVYALSNPFAVPFMGVIKPSVNFQNGTIIEWSTILAMLVYFLIAWGIMSLIHMLRPVTPEEVDQAI